MKIEAPKIPFEIWSGGQTGVDRGALEGAQGACLTTGGWAPLGFITEGGPSPDLGERFGLHEYPSSGYAPRTRENVQQADLTVIIAKDPLSRGTSLTREICDQLGKPYYEIAFTGTKGKPFEELDHEAYYLAWWLATYHDGLGQKVLSGTPWRVNFAGNRESVAPGIQTFTRWLVVMTCNMYLDRVLAYGRGSTPEPFPSAPIEPSSPENAAPAAEAEEAVLDADEIEGKLEGEEEIEEIEEPVEAADFPEEEAVEILEDF